MKKLVIASLIALAAGTVSAMEIGLTAGRNFAKPAPHSFGNGCGFIVGPMTCTQGQDRNEYGITLGERFGKFGLAAGISTSSGGSPITFPTDGPYKDNIQDRYSIVGSYDVFNLRNTTVVVKTGVSYLNNQRAADGYALTVGAGVVYPVTKQVALTADYARQYGQKRVNQFDGNQLGVGIKYAF
jgi:hypothetical protein